MFDLEPSTIQIFKGQTAMFECRVRTPLRPSGSSYGTSADFSVEWLKDEQPLILDHRMKVLPSGSLEIVDSQLPDRGSYRCRVSHPQDPDSARVSKEASLRISTDLAASLVPVAPTFVTSPRSVKVVGEGGTITMDCVAIGYPKPFITWLKDGSTIDLNHLDSRFVRIGEGSLQIRDVHVGDEGSYQCRAENSEDSTDEAATLAVQVKPSFVRWPEDTVAFENEDIVLQCEVYSRPQAAVQWYKNGELIIESEYFQVATALLGLGSIIQIRGLFLLLWWFWAHF